MTATAFAFDPVLESHGDPVVVVGRRPDLRVIQDPSSQRVPAPVGRAAGRGSRQHAAQAAEPAQLRELHRRRRFLALLVLSAVVLAVAWASGVSIVSFPGAAASSVGAQDGAPIVHVVLPGDTYGAIAAEWGADNPVVAGQELRAANGGAELVVGQRLVLDSTILDSTILDSTLVATGDLHPANAP